MNVITQTQGVGEHIRCSPFTYTSIFPSIFWTGETEICFHEHERVGDERERKSFEYKYRGCKHFESYLIYSMKTPVC